MKLILPLALSFLFATSSVATENTYGFLAPIDASEKGNGFLEQSDFGEKGNGGDAVVCFESNAHTEKVRSVLKHNKMTGDNKDPLADIPLENMTVELLDLKEASQLKNYTAHEFDGQYNEIIDKIFLQLEKYTDHARSSSDNYIGYYQENMNHWMHSNHGVMEIDDSKHKINFGDHCEIIQIAYREKTLNTDIVYYELRLFEKLSETHKASLFFHEWIYAAYLENAFPNMSNWKGADSKPVRLLVGELFSDSFMSATSGYNFVKLIDNLKIPIDTNYYELEVLNIFDKEFSFYGNMPTEDFGLINTPFGEVTLNSRHKNKMSFDGSVKLKDNWVDGLVVTFDKKGRYIKYLQSNIEPSEGFKFDDIYVISPAEYGNNSFKFPKVVFDQNGNLIKIIPGSYLNSNGIKQVFPYKIIIENEKPKELATPFLIDSSQ